MPFVFVLYFSTNIKNRIGSLIQWQSIRKVKIQRAYAIQRVSLWKWKAIEKELRRRACGQTYSVARMRILFSFNGKEMHHSWITFFLSLRALLKYKMNLRIKRNNSIEKFQVLLIVQSSAFGPLNYFRLIVYNSDKLYAASINHLRSNHPSKSCTCYPSILFRTIRL